MKLKGRRRSTKGNDVLSSLKSTVSSEDDDYTTNQPEDFQECSLPLHKRRIKKISHKYKEKNSSFSANSDDEVDEPVIFRSFIKNALIQSPGDSDDNTPNVSFTDADSDYSSYVPIDYENYMSESNLSEFAGTDDETEDEYDRQRIAIKRKTKVKTVEVNDENSFLVDDEKKVVVDNEKKVVVSDERKIVVKEHETESEVTLSKDINEQFIAFRLTYLIVHLAIMLADGLQGKGNV